MNNKTTANKRNDVSSKSLNSYSLAGIGIGGVIGAGFFLGSSLAVNQAGPSIIIAFFLGGLIMSQVLGAMTSISLNRPVRGSFRVYTEEFLGRYVGYLLGLTVYVSGVLTLSSEALAAGIFLKYWFPHINIAIFALSVLIIVIIINALGTKGFGYAETGMAVIKIAILIIFIILGGIFLISNGITISQRPFSSIKAFFPNGISGFLQSMLIVIFTYAGISAIAMATNEVKKPRKEIPRATLLMTFGVVTLYTLSMAVVVSMVPWNTINTSVSPFIQAFNKMGITLASTVMNIIILIAAISVMLATYFSCTQILVSLSEAKEMPTVLNKYTNTGFFRNAWLTTAGSSLLVVGISFVLGSKVFNYLVSASSYFSFLNWSVNLLTYLAWLKRRNANEISSPLIFGRTGAYVTLIAIILLVIISLRVADFRIGFYVAVAAMATISISYKTMKC